MLVESNTKELLPGYFKFPFFVLICFYIKMYFECIRRNTFILSWKKFCIFCFYAQHYTTCFGDKTFRINLLIDYNNSEFYSFNRFLRSISKKSLPKYFKTYDLLLSLQTEIDDSVIEADSTFPKKIHSLQNIIDSQKIFNKYYIFGIKNFNNTYDILDTILKVCLSQSTPIWKNYEHIFDIKFLIKLRAETNNISRKQIFHLLKLKIEEAKVTKDLKIIQAVFNEFIKLIDVKDTSVLHKMILGIDLFNKQQMIYDSIVFKPCYGNLRDIFDASGTGCCSLAPSQYWNLYKPALDYLNNPSVLLVRLERYKNNIELDLAGVIILSLCKDTNNDNLLLVDSLELAKINNWPVSCLDYIKIDKKDIFELCENTINEIAKQTKSNKVIFCKTVSNESAKSFVKFVKTKYKLKEQQSYLELLNLTPKVFLEAFYDHKNPPQKIPKGNVFGYIKQLTNSITIYLSNLMLEFNSLILTIEGRIC